MTRKKQLLVILGAGSSLPLGMPSVGLLGEAMRDWSGNWLNDKDASGPASESCFVKVRDSIERYYQSSDRLLNPESQPQVSFEKALGDMLALAHWVMPAPYGTTLRQIVGDNGSHPELRFPSDSVTGRYRPEILINAELSYLLGELAKHMRSNCRDFDDKRVGFRSYQAFFGALRTAFDVGVYNLNYDDLALRACPEVFTGFGPDGFFDSSAVCSRTEWGFLYHLRGSVHHTLAGPSSWRLCQAFARKYSSLACCSGGKARSSKALHQRSACAVPSSRPRSPDASMSLATNSIPSSTGRSSRFSRDMRAEKSLFSCSSTAYRRWQVVEYSVQSVVCHSLR
jgi:hypothetical protein